MFRLPIAYRNLTRFQDFCYFVDIVDAAGPDAAAGRLQGGPEPGIGRQVGMGLQVGVGFAGVEQRLRLGR